MNTAEREDRNDAILRFEMPEEVRAALAGMVANAALSMRERCAAWIEDYHGDHHFPASAPCHCLDFADSIRQLPLLSGQ